jgi:spore maturation protein SpmB
MLIWGIGVSIWILPSFIIIILLFGISKKIDVYASFVEGAKQGFETAVKIIPYLVAMFAAISIFRASGAFDLLIAPLGKITEPLGLPIDALPMALLRPFSGSGSLAVLAETINQPHIGPDSYTGNIVSTIMGSTETTFYVLAVYFGAVQVKKVRYALACALFADLIGIIMSVISVNMLL